MALVPRNIIAPGGAAGYRAEKRKEMTFRLNDWLPKRGSSHKAGAEGFDPFNAL